MSVTRTKIIEKNIKALRLSGPVQSFTGEVAEKVATAAGPGFVAKRGAGINRPRWVVVPTTPEAYKANYKNLAVVRALGKV